MHLAQNILSIAFVVTFLVNGILCGKANDSRFLAGPRTPLGNKLFGIWMIANILSLIAQFAGWISIHINAFICSGGLIAWFSAETVQKVRRIRDGDTAVNPNGAT